MEQPSPIAVRRALVLMDGLERSRRPLLPADDHPAFRAVGGLPVADRLVRHLATQGVAEVCMAVHDLPGLVVHYFADGAAWGVHVTYQYEQRPWGSGGAVAQSFDFCTETTLVLPGAFITDLAFGPLVAAHRMSGAAITAVVGRSKGGRPRPPVAVDTDGRLTAYAAARGDDASPSMTDVGVYLVEPALLERLPRDTLTDWTREIMPQLVQERQVHGWGSQALFLHVATPEDARQAEDALRAA